MLYIALYGKNKVDKVSQVDLGLEKASLKVGSELTFLFRDSGEGNLELGELSLTEPQEREFLKGLSLMMPFYNNKNAKWSCYLPGPHFHEKISSSREVVYFGGTFNPWHEGHSECVRQLKGKSLFIVPDHNPFKDKQGIRSLEAYLEIMNKVSAFRVSLFPGFIGEEKNPTVDWFLKISYPRKSLVIGDDNFVIFKQWKDYQELLKHCFKVYVIPRTRSMKELEILKTEFEQSEKFVIMEEHRFRALSSSAIRSDKTSN